MHMSIYKYFKNLPRLKKTTLQLQTANGSSLKVNSAVTLKFKIGGVI